jgi:hypothetical protein
MKKIAMGCFGDWDKHVVHFLNQDEYKPVFVDFTDFDLAAVDAAVPLTLQDAAALRYRHGERHAKYLIPDVAVTALCADKKRFAEWALAGPFAACIPPIYPPGAEQFPCMLKRRRMLSGLGIVPIRDAAEARAHRAALNDKDHFCQAYVPGRFEYATHLLIDDDGAKYHSSNRYEMAGEFAVKGNQQRPIRDEFGVEIPERILKRLTEIAIALGFRGTCSIDYKILDGELHVLELNPRIGSSLFRDINAYLASYIAVLHSAAHLRRIG